MRNRTYPEPEAVRTDDGARPHFLSVSMDHGNFNEQSKTVLNIDRRLRSGKTDRIELDEYDLIKLIAQATECLAIRKGVRT